MSSYADDLVVVTEAPDELQDMVTAIERYCTSTGLQLHAEVQVLCGRQMAGSSSDRPRQGHLPRTTNDSGYSGSHLPMPWKSCAGSKEGGYETLRVPDKVTSAQRNQGGSSNQNESCGDSHHASAYVWQLEPQDQG